MEITNSINDATNLQQDRSKDSFDADEIWPPVTATIVTSEEERLAFLPRFFGPRFIEGEALVYSFMRRFSHNYRGGSWNFYTLSNGGFYMAPEGTEPLHVFIKGNGFDGDLSPDAAGIVATSSAIADMSNEMFDYFYNQWCLLHDYARVHPEFKNNIYVLE